MDSKNMLYNMRTPNNNIPALRLGGVWGINQVENSHQFIR